MSNFRFFLILINFLISFTLKAQTSTLTDSALFNLLEFNADQWQADSNGRLGYRDSYYKNFRTDSNWLKMSTNQILKLLGNSTETILKPEMTSYIYSWYGRGYVYLLVFETKHGIILDIKTIRGCG